MFADAAVVFAREIFAGSLREKARKTRGRVVFVEPLSCRTDPNQTVTVGLDFLDGSGAALGQSLETCAVETMQFARSGADEDVVRPVVR